MKEHTLTIPARGAELNADLVIPARPVGLVLFAHGSGSSRKSPRNRFVAKTLQESGLGTLLFDLLTEEEARRDALDAHLRFDIPMLADRLDDVTTWMRTSGPVHDLPISYFGSSTGAAAALIAAARRGDIAAVVSRGGRPDLAGPALERVRAPTLLLVGGEDHVVMSLNHDALALLAGEKQLTVIPGAGHLFEEPGTLEAVADRAAKWLREHSGPRDRERSVVYG